MFKKALGGIRAAAGGLTPRWLGLGSQYLFIYIYLIQVLQKKSNFTSKNDTKRVCEMITFPCRKNCTATYSQYTARKRE